jgi:hypothetical protein
MSGTNPLRPLSRAWGHYSNVHMNEAGSALPSHAHEASGVADRVPPEEDQGRGQVEKKRRQPLSSALADALAERGRVSSV